MIVVISGTFDYFHRGHKNLIDAAHRCFPNAYFVVCVNADSDSQKELIDDEWVRQEAVWEYVVQCKNLGVRSFIADRANTLRAIQEHAKSKHPVIFVHGDDWNQTKLSQHYNVPEEFWQNNNIQLIFFPRTKGISSTQIRERLNA